jgi:hypothetical protein
MQPGLFTLFIPGKVDGTLLFNAPGSALFPYLYNLVSCALTQFVRLHET